MSLAGRTGNETNKVKMAPGSYHSPRRDETAIPDYHGSKIADTYV